MKSRRDGLICLSFPFLVNGVKTAVVSCDTTVSYICTRFIRTKAMQLQCDHATGNSHNKHTPFLVT